MCQLMVYSWVTYEQILMYAPYALYLCFLVMVNFGFGMGILFIGKTWLTRVYVSIYGFKFCSTHQPTLTPCTTHVYPICTQTTQYHTFIHLFHTRAIHMYKPNKKYNGIHQFVLTVVFCVVWSFVFVAYVTIRNGLHTPYSLKYATVFSQLDKHIENTSVYVNGCSYDM